jgi:serine/threonine protein kinase
MMRTIRCPNESCQSEAKIPERFLGRTVQCRQCKHKFRAADPDDGLTDSREAPAESNANQPRLQVPPQTQTYSFTTYPAAFGRYTVLRQLGQGGMGAVYLAQDQVLNRRVALKLPLFAGANVQRRVERFLREARAAAQLQHPNLCTVYDVGQHEEQPYLTMAFIDGHTLAEQISSGPLPPLTALRLVEQLARGMQVAHAAGIVHRDLKPANIMLTSAGTPIILDFGLALHQTDVEDEQRLTNEGAVLGTPRYMAPEQVLGELAKIGPATDVYALGIILFELLTGRTPFEGPNTAIYAQVLALPVPALATWRPGLPPACEELVQRALAKDPRQRFASMADWADALRQTHGAPGQVLALPVPVLPNPAPNPSVWTDIDEENDDRTQVESAPAPTVLAQRKYGRWAQMNWRWKLLVGGVLLVGLVGVMALVSHLLTPVPGGLIVHIHPLTVNEIEMQLGTRAGNAYTIGDRLSVPPGRWTLQLTKPGYLPINEVLLIEPGKTLTKSFSLRLDPDAPPELRPKPTQVPKPETLIIEVPALDPLQPTTPFNPVTEATIARRLLRRGFVLELSDGLVVRESSQLPKNTFFVRKLSVSGNGNYVPHDVNDDDMLMTAQLVNLEVLYIPQPTNQGQITDKGYEAIGRLKNLIVLQLDGAKIADRQLAFFNDMKNLRELHLVRTSINASGFREVTLPSLERLLLEKASDQGMEALSQLNNLIFLNCNFANCSPESVRHLKKLAIEELLASIPTLEMLEIFTEVMPDLRRLNLSDQPHITDDWLPTLGKFKNLASLSLHSTSVSDAAIIPLQKMASLRVVDLRNTRITLQGVNFLKQRRPKLEILQGG